MCRNGAKRTIRVLAALVAPGLAWGLVAAPAAGQHVCSRTATDARIACLFEVNEEFWEARGICRNEPDPAEEQACL
jgi:hypothetical protein